MNEHETSMEAAAMPLDTAADALDGLRRVKEYDRDEAPEAVTPEDQEEITALEVAVRILRALDDEGIADSEELRDLLYDYRQQGSELESCRKRLAELENIKSRLMSERNRLAEQCGKLSTEAARR